MKASDNNARVEALSDDELEVVSGGRHQVTKEQYEILLAVRMAVAKGAGLAPIP
jgi:hypothetical protein